MKNSKGKKINLTRWKVITLIYGLATLIYTVLQSINQVTHNMDCERVAMGFFVLATICLTVLMVNNNHFNDIDDMGIMYGHCVAIVIIGLLAIVFMINTKNNTFINILSDGNVIYRSESLGIWLKAIIFAIASNIMVTIYSYVAKAVWKIVSLVL